MKPATVANVEGGTHKPLVTSSNLVAATNLLYNPHFDISASVNNYASRVLTLVSLWTLKV
jgi:hypothetical protein